MPHFTHFSVHRHGDITDVHLVDTKFFDLSDYAELQEELRQFVETEKPVKLLVHFDLIEYCSTAVISGLMDVQKKQLAEGHQMRICGISEHVRDSFRRLKLDGKVFEIYVDEQEAAASF